MFGSTRGFEPKGISVCAMLHGFNTSEPSRPKHVMLQAALIILLFETGAFMCWVFVFPLAVQPRTLGNDGHIWNRPIWAFSASIVNYVAKSSVRGSPIFRTVVYPE